MSADLIMWLLGGAGTLAVSLLGLILSEIRGMRRDLSSLEKSYTIMIGRVDNLDAIVCKLPCYREFVCPSNH